MTPLELVEQLIDISDTVKAKKKQAEADQYYAEQEYNDLNHALEFTKFHASEGYKLARQLQDNRQRRRNAKNILEQLKPLHDLMNKHKSFFSELKNVHAQIETTIHTQQNRAYRPRVREDLFENVRG